MALTYVDTSFIFGETLGKAKVSGGMEDTYASWNLVESYVCRSRAPSVALSCLLELQLQAATYLPHGALKEAATVVAQGPVGL